MRKFFAVFFLLVFVLPSIRQVECQEKSNLIKSLNYRQREFFDQWRYLSGKETKIAQELNGEIRVYNNEASLLTLQKIEDLKVKVIENLQDQIKNDRDYISYLEYRLTDLLDHKFVPLMLKKDAGPGGEPLKSFEAKKEEPMPPAPQQPEPALQQEAAPPKTAEPLVEAPRLKDEGLPEPEAKAEEPQRPEEDDIEALMDEIMINIKGLKRR